MCECVWVGANLVASLHSMFMFEYLFINFCSGLAGVPPAPPGGSGVLMMQLSVPPPPPPPTATQWKHKYYSLEQQHQHHGSKPSELGLGDTTQVRSCQVNRVYTETK